MLEAADVAWYLMSVLGDAEAGQPLSLRQILRCHAVQ